MGCGGGAIAGIIAGNNKARGDRRPPDLKLPAIDIPNDRAPIFLLGSDLEFRALSVRNVALGLPLDPARIRVELISDALKIVEEQRTISLSKVDENRFNVSFQVKTAQFLAHFTGRQKEDVQCKLRLYLDGRRVAPDGTFVLVQPPRIDRILSKEQDGAVEVSVNGSSRVILELGELQARDAKDLSVRVFQRNYFVASSEPDAIREVEAELEKFVCLERDPVSGLCLRARVTVVAPSSKFPGVSILLVRDRSAGWQDLSTPGRLLYAPELDRLSPETASLLGGVPAVLLGSGLVPARNETGKIEYLFEDVELTLIKGGARVHLANSSIRTDLSNSQQLFFLLPRSPDGLPGEAVLELTQRFGDDVLRRVVRRLGASSGAPGARFGVETPQLSPRVTMLLRKSTQLVPGHYFPGGFGGEELALFSTGGDYGQVAMLRAAGFGVYREIGRPINVVGQRLETGRMPLALLPGSFQRSATGQLFVISGAGAKGPNVGQHALLKSTAQVESPFAVEDTELRAAQAILVGRSADLDKDGMTDLVFARVANGGEANLEILSGGLPTPRSQVLSLPNGFRPDLLQLVDLDRDASLDILCGESGGGRRLAFWTGNGLGAFTGPKLLACEPHVGFFESGTKLIELCPVAQGSGLPHDVYVLAARGKPGGKQWILPLRYAAASRMLLGPKPSEILELPASLPTLRVGLPIQLDGRGRDELLVGTEGGSGPGLVGFSLDAVRPALLPTDLVPEDAGMRAVVGLKAARLWKRSSERGLLVLHEELVDQTKLPVISALPIAGGRLHSRRSLLGAARKKPPARVLSGDWNGNGNENDLLLAVDSELEFYFDQGSGSYSEKPDLLIPVPGLIAPSVEVLSSKNGVLVWLEQGGELVHYDLRQKQRSSRDVRGYLDPPRQSGLLGSASRVRASDHDQNSVLDLSLWLVPAVIQSQDTGVLVALRRSSQPSKDIPFVVTEASAVLRVPPQFRDLQVAELLPHSKGHPGIEASLLGTRTVVFFTLLVEGVPGADRYSYLPGVLPDLRLDSDPSQLLFTELGSPFKGTVGQRDMVVLAGGRIRFFRNRFVRSNERLLGAFEPLSDYAYPGVASGLAAGDFNGDGISDIFVLSRRVGSNPGPSLCLFAGLGAGSFRSCYVYPSLLHMPRFYGSFTTRDFDGNGQADLVLGRDLLLSR